MSAFAPAPGRASSSSWGNLIECPYSVGVTPYGHSSFLCGQLRPRSPCVFVNPMAARVAPWLHIRRRVQRERALHAGERHRERRGDLIVQGANMAMCQP